MEAPLLTTKLFIPRPHAGLIPRPRLVQRLEEGLHQGRKLSLISAPAGFGKTTVIAEWLARTPRPQPLRASWLSLDEADNDPAVFFTYLIAGLRQLDDAMGQATQSLLGSPQMPPPRSLAAMLVSDLSAVATPCVFVLDDYQAIGSPVVHGVLAFLLDHAPPQIHLVVATRADPPLPLARLRVREQMTELRSEDLRFVASEVGDFLDRALDRALTGGQIAALETRTEGWIAGLQLAALSLRSRPDFAGFVEAFSGSNRHVIDYLAEEVLAQQPEEIRDFLRQVAMLDRFCAPLCDAVRGARDDSRSLLEQLERRNLFLVPLDERREWYRFHHLFAGFLRSEVDRTQSAALHQRAADWFEEQGLLPEAVHHALVHVAATGDTTDAVRLLIEAGSRALADGALVTLLSWMDGLSDEVVRACGGLASLKAWALLMTGQPEMAESYIRSAEASLKPDALSVDRGRVLSLRCAMAGAEDVLRMAPSALEWIGDADPFSRTGTLFLLGDAQDEVGDVVGAEKTFREAYQLGLQHGHRIMAAVARAHLTLSINCQGRLREALAICRAGVEQYVDTRGNPLPIAALLHAVLGELTYEQNDLDRAVRYLRTGLELARRSETTLVILCSLGALCRVQAAMGHEREALATLQEAQERAARSGNSEWFGAAVAIEAGLRLRQGDLAAARQWAENMDLPLDPIAHGHWQEYTNWGRVLLALERASEARALLSRLEHEAHRDGRRRHLLTIHIQQALAEHRLGNETEAQAYLESAVGLAAPEGYTRAFLDEDVSLERLLARAHPVAPRFVEPLLASLGQAHSSEHPASRSARSLIEPLSDRELAVLRLLGTYQSVPEIARELFVATSTVRSHIKHIYEKLGAHSRHEAIARAKALSVL